jgi:predicted RND superfamily exporter protein
MVLDKIRNFNDQVIWDRVGALVEKRSIILIIATFVITLLLLYPLIMMAPDETASDNAGGEVFDLTDKIDEKFPPSYYNTAFIIESKEGDVLTQEVLWELLLNEEVLRNSEISQYLYNSYDVETSRMIFGVFTIADMVHVWLDTSFGIGLFNATDELVKLALHYIFSDPQTTDMKDWLSPDATSETGTVLGQEITIWKAKAFAFAINSDKDLVLDEYSKGLDGEDDRVMIKEHFDRDLQKKIRGEEENYRVWGIAIDQNLEANDEASISFLLIFAAVILILVIVTIQFRSVKVSLLTLIGLGMLIVWLKGLSNLVGLNSSLTLDIIVPVAILVLGVDYVIHSMHRYHEEKEKVGEPKKAFGLGIAGVGSALFLAMLTTVMAFLSNATSGIESVIGFGIAAGMAIVSAFIIMGLFVPAVKMHWDNFGYQRMMKKGNKDGEKKDPDRTEKTEKPHGNKYIGKAVMLFANRKFIVIFVVLLLSVVSAYYAFQIEAKLDVKEFFDSESDFVVSLDKLNEHVGEKAGEPAIIYIEGDLSQPEALQAIKDMESRMDDDKTVARDMDDGTANLYVGLFDFLAGVLNSPVAIQRIEAANPGLNITDTNDDKLPDTAAQNKAIYDYIVVHGVPLNETTILYTPARIGENFYHDPTGVEQDALICWIGILNTREQKAARDSKEEIQEDMKALDQTDYITYYGITGSPYTRDETLSAITDSLSVSIIVAIALCLVLLIVVLRSFKYAIVTVIPEILVAVWLYAFMFLAGYHLNIVTATIAAISIGVGIDYSVHITARFRQELEKVGNKFEALEQTARHSGAALFGSAASTIVGFAIIGFAPMPMFSSFGILTAIMIVMALVAALFVLPSLLLLVTWEKKKQK